MKHFVRFITTSTLWVVLSAGLLFAEFAQIPNNTFANWENKNFGDHPTEWIMNSLDENTENVAEKTTDAYLGNYAVKLSTFFVEEDGGKDQQGYVGFLDGLEAPMPWNDMVDMLHVYVKYSIKPNGAAGIGIALWDGDEPYSTTIFPITGNSDDSWEHIQIPLDLDANNPRTPNGIQIYFTADVCRMMEDECSYIRNDGSWMIVDNVFLTYQDDDATSPIYPENHSFEDWSTRTIYEPVNWASENIDFAEPNNYPVTPFTDGDYSGVKIEVKETPWGSKRNRLWLEDNTMAEGMPYTEKPMAAAITYKYIPVNGDDARAHISIEDENNSYGNSLQLEASDVFVRKMASWFIPEDINPQRLYIQFEAGDKTGSILYIDKIEFIALTEVTFDVRSTSTNQPITNAKIIIPAMPGDYYTDHTGRFNLNFDQGSYNYSVASYGYNTKNGSVTVGANNQTVTIYLDDFTPDASKPIIQLNDHDQDKVYFNGDNIYASIQLPAAAAFLNNKNVKIVAVLFTGENGSNELYPIFGNGWEYITTISNNSLIIDETISNVSKAGVIGIHVKQVEVEPSPGVFIWQDIPGSVPFPLIDTYKYVKEISNYGMPFVGISIPTDNVTTSPSLSAFANLYNTEQTITFTKVDKGSILFASGLNFMDNYKKLESFNTDFRIVSNPQALEFYVEINPQTLGFLSNVNTAIVTINNIPNWVESTLDLNIYYSNYGMSAEDMHWWPAYNTYGWSLNDTENSFSFYTNHFSRYTIDVPQNPATGINTKSSDLISVYPTIVDDVIYIDTDLEIVGSRIVDLNGKILQINDSNKAIQVSSLTTGLYLLFIQPSSGEQQVIKIQKK